MARYSSNRKSKNKSSNPIVTIILIALILGGIYLYNRWEGKTQDSQEQESFEFSDMLGVKTNSSQSEGADNANNSKKTNNKRRNSSTISSPSTPSSSQNKKSNVPKDAQGNYITPEQYWDVNMPSSIVSKRLDYTGMTISFNPELHIPNWVAWELTGKETRGRLERSDNFMPDPNCKETAQLYDYKNSGYDRGHMCPAADAKWDPKFMQEVFYMTNMCPQDHELNTGEWNDLEVKCREWARIDSAIIIITGPVLTDKLTKTIGRTKVAVPERFFKVILSPYANPPRAIGFVMANRNNPGGMERNAYSIDEVEEITGYDFFSILDDKVENKIESVNDFNTWSRLKKKR